MKSFPCVTWLQRGAASRKPGIKIIAPALMTCDEVDISFNLATQVAELMTFLVEARTLSGISIFCLSVFWQVAFVTMSNVLYLLKAFLITHPGKVASYSVTLFTAIAVPSF